MRKRGGGRRVGLFGELLGFGAEVGAEEEALDDHAEDVFEGEVGLLDVHGGGRRG